MYVCVYSIAFLVQALDLCSLTYCANAMPPTLFIYIYIYIYIHQRGNLNTQTTTRRHTFFCAIDAIHDRVVITPPSRFADICLVVFLEAACSVAVDIVSYGGFIL